MGLDMYLEREYSVYSQADKNKSDVDIYINGKKQPMLSDSFRVVLDVGYWRNAYAIHNWFVQNVQHGIDKCQRTWLTKEQLKQLQSDCKAVLTDISKADELLPEPDRVYDEFYKKYVEYTDALIEQLDLDNNDIVCEYYYQASW